MKRELGASPSRVFKLSVILYLNLVCVKCVSVSYAYGYPYSKTHCDCCARWPL